LPVQMRDRLGELFPDAAFAEAFGRAGKEGWSPGRLALVTVLQTAANLTDRRAADEVRESLAWKYALDLGLEDPGFDHSVLSEFRSRVVSHGLEERVLDLLLELLTAGGSQRTDSTHIVSAVRDLNRLELVGESVRAALNALTGIDPRTTGAAEGQKPQGVCRGPTASAAWAGEGRCLHRGTGRTATSSACTPCPSRCRCTTTRAPRTCTVP